MGCNNFEFASWGSEDHVEFLWLCELMNTVLAVKVSVGLLSLIAAIVSLILFFMFRRYKKDHMTEIVVTERLILYNTVAGIVRSVVDILQLTEVNYTWVDHSHNYILIHEDLCLTIGLLDHWSTWSVLLTTEMIMVHLFIQLTFGVGASKKLIIEIFYVAFPVLFPLLFSWVPLIPSVDYAIGGYGMTVVWCSIYSLSQIIFLLGPMIIFQIINIIFISVVYPKLFFKKIKKEDRCDLIKQHGPLLLLLLLAVVTNIIVFGNRLLFLDFYWGYGSFVKSMWIIHAIASSCWGIISAIVIMLYLLALYRLQPHERHHDDDDHCQDNPVFNIQMQLNYSSCIESSGEI